MSARQPKQERLPAPLRITLLYAAFGVSWITLGDVALWLRGEVLPTGAVLGLLKGLLFVALSATLLYVLVGREVRRRQRAWMQLDTVLHTAPIGIAAVDSRGRITGWNRFAAQLTGWSEEDVVGRGAEELGLAPEPHEDAPADGLLAARDGARIDIRLVGSAAASDGSRVLVFRDRRPQMEIEAALRRAQRMEAVGRLAGGVAHEFNNVLTAIMGHAVLLAEALGPEDDRVEHAEEVRRAANRAAALTRQLLVFSGKHITQPSTLDLSEVLADMRAAATRLAGDSVETELALENGLWPVRCDHAQLQQLVLNLIVNAREAMPAGGHLRIETANFQSNGSRATDVPPGDFVLLRVSDTGGGMTQETMAHLFEPFFTTKAQGTGLGLATVYGIVQQCDGHIRVRSRPAAGAVFEIYLPRDSAAAPQDQPHAARRGGDGALLLVVDDDDAVRELTCRVLRRAGYRVLPASGGGEALERLGSDAAEVALVIADIVMPGMSGFELGEQIRRDRPALPILFTSGYVAGGLSGEDELPPGTHFLEKPYRPEQLLELTRRMLTPPAVLAGETGVHEPPQSLS